jgi:hypothetical protein
MKPSGFNQGLQTTFTLFLSKMERLTVVIGLRWAIAAAACLIIFALPSISCACRIPAYDKAAQAHASNIYKVLAAQWAEGETTTEAGLLAMATLASKHCLFGMPLDIKFEYADGRKLKENTFKYGWSEAPSHITHCSVKYLPTKKDFEVRVGHNQNNVYYESVNGNPGVVNRKIHPEEVVPFILIGLVVIIIGLRAFLAKKYAAISNLVFYSIEISTGITSVVLAQTSVFLLVKQQSCGSTDLITQCYILTLPITLIIVSMCSIPTFWKIIAMPFLIIGVMLISLRFLPFLAPLLDFLIRPDLSGRV